MWRYLCGLNITPAMRGSMTRVMNVRVMASSVLAKNL